MSEPHRVVITGIGVVTPIGNNVPEFLTGLREGRNGIIKITRFDTANLKVKLCGEVKNLNIEDYIDKKEIRRTDRFNQLALIAADEAVKDSGICFDKIDKSRVGLYVTSGVGGLDTLSAEVEKCIEKGERFVSPFLVPMMIPDMAGGTIAIKYGLTGASMAHVSACASSTNAIGEAYRSIKHGYHDMFIAGGAESVVNKIALAGFQNMTALSLSEDETAASLPFDKRRAGFVMGEGAGILIMESYERAKARGAKIYAEIAGYGSTTDAYHITLPDPEGCGAERAMRLAIEESGLIAADVDYINAHGTGTPPNDKFETVAIKKVFGEDTKVAVNSTKSMTGHLLGGTGAVEAVATILQMNHGFLHPTINLLEQDPECNLNVVKAVKEAKIRAAVSNSLGFGGHNASILIKAID